MLFAIADNFLSLCEFIWKLFPVPKEIIHKFGLSRRYLDYAFTFIGRRDLEYDWVINVLLDGWIEFFEIHELVYIYKVKLNILKV